MGKRRPCTGGTERADTMAEAVMLRSTAAKPEDDRLTLDLPVVPAAFLIFLCIVVMVRGFLSWISETVLRSYTMFS